MGVPVSGKNLLPSNIQGMPTWYEIRVNFDSHTARASSFDLVVAMNAQTYVEDVASVRTGGYVLFDSSALGELPQREDVHYLGVPFSTLIVEQFTAADDLVLLKNIAYVGSLVAVLEIDRGIVDELLAERFRRNEHAASRMREHCSLASRAPSSCLTARCRSTSSRCTRTQTRS